MANDPAVPLTLAATPDELTSRIFAWRRGFNALHLIDLGERLGLFEALAGTPGMSVDELASRLGLHAPYVKVWCMTACSLALLQADQVGRLSLAPHVDAVLADPRHPRNLCGYVRLGTQFATDDYRFAVDAFRSGATVPFSKEALLTRNSSWIIQSGQNARDGGLITREIEMLKYVAGTLGKWKFGKNDSTFTEYNTYNTAVTGSAVKNSLTANPLDSWTNIDTAMQAFRDMKDPVSGEFIAQPKSVVLIVPMCIFMKANVIKNAVVTTNYNAAIASATIRYEGPNPLNAALTIEIMASPYFDEITGSTSSTYTWYMGQPTKCFVNDQVWAPKFEELSDGGEGSFWKDLALALKLSWMEQYVVQNNTQMLKIANS